jgi:ATP-binding cassette subfamily B protein
MTSDTQQRPLDLGIIRRLFEFTRPYARTRNTLLALVVLRAIQLPLVTWAMARVLSGPIARQDAAGTVRGVFGFLALAALTELCFVFRGRLALRLGEAVVHDLRNDIFAKLLQMPMSFFARTPVGRLVGRVTADVDVVRVGVQDVAFVSTVQAGQAVLSAALMIYYDWRLFLVVLLIVPGIWSLIRRLRGRLSQAYRDQAESFARVTTTLAETVAGIRVIQSFARETASGARFNALVHDHAGFNMAAHRRAAMLQPVLELSGQIFLSMVLVIGGYQALGGGVTLEALIQFLFLSNGLFAAVPNIGNQYNQALTAMAGAERVFRLLDTPPDWRDADDARPLDADGPVRGRVELERVSFAYPVHQGGPGGALVPGAPGRPALEDVSLSVDAGRMLALVGPTGSGKSTLAALVAKLYLPSSGRISIDGRDLAGVTGASLHRHVACVTQENFLFSGTVMDNVRVGRPDASDDDVRAAVAALGLQEIVAALPGGFAADVGEGGARLSLGQRQVICFARAMLADPKILILDEATSSVDALTELALQAALAKLFAGRTSIVIAHRLSTVRHAHDVVVLDHGKVLERGPHQTLLAQGGRYADMCRRLSPS